MKIRKVAFKTFLLVVFEVSEEVSKKECFGAQQKCVIKDSGRNNARINQMKIQNKPNASNFKICNQKLNFQLSSIRIFIMRQRHTTINHLLASSPRIRF